MHNHVVHQVPMQKDKTKHWQLEASLDEKASMLLQLPSLLSD